MKMKNEKWRWRMRNEDEGWEMKMKDEKWRFRMRIEDEGWELKMKDEKWRWRMRSEDEGWEMKMKKEKWKWRKRTDRRNDEESCEELKLIFNFVVLVEHNCSFDVSNLKRVCKPSTWSDPPPSCSTEMLNFKESVKICILTKFFRNYVFSIQHLRKGKEKGK